MKQEAGFEFMNSIKPFLVYVLLISAILYEFYKNFLNLLIIDKYYTMNSIKPFVAIQFIILDFSRQLLLSLCITNYHINTVIKEHASK